MAAYLADQSAIKWVGPDFDLWLTVHCLTTPHVLLGGHLVTTTWRSFPPPTSHTSCLAVQQISFRKPAVQSATSPGLIML